MKVHNVINHMRDLLSLNYKGPLLSHVVFHLDEVESEHFAINRKRLLFITFSVLAAVASVSVIERFMMPVAKDLFFVKASMHASLEIFCGLISGIIAFILTWEYQVSGKKNILLIVFAFFSTGILDVFHAISDYDHNAFVWFHSYSALFGSVFLTGSTFLNKNTGHPAKSSWARSGIVVSGIALIVLFALLTAKMEDIFPNVLSIKPLQASAIEVRGQFSNVIYAINFISCMLYLLVGIVFVKGFLKTNDVIYLIFGTAAILFFESELLFSFSKLWDPLWWYWHIIKVMIFSGLLIGLAYGFTHTVYRLHESKVKLANFLKEIEQKNSQIRNAYDRLKEMQKYLKESEKLASMGKMAAMVAHEIRNPIGAISNSLGALKRYSSLNHDDIELIGIVEKEMDRLNNMTEDFLSFARPSQLKRELCEIHPLVQDTIALLQQRGENSWTAFRIEHSFAPDVPRLMLDKNRFRQILLNLLINARQAMPAGGEVSISTRFKRSENEVEITIADSGSGMSKEILSQAFQPFFTTKDSGLGLGLNIVNKLMKEHSGYILLSSTPGKGTHVQLNFPAPGKDEATNKDGSEREENQPERNGE